VVMGDHDGLGIHDTCPPSNSAAAIAAAAAAEGAGESILAVSSSFYNFSFLSPFFYLFLQGTRMSLLSAAFPSLLRPLLPLSAGGATGGEEDLSDSIFWHWFFF